MMTNHDKIILGIDLKNQENCTEVLSMSLEGDILERDQWKFCDWPTTIERILRIVAGRSAIVVIDLLTIGSVICEDLRGEGFIVYPAVNLYTDGIDPAKTIQCIRPDVLYRFRDQ